MTKRSVKPAADLPDQPAETVPETEAPTPTARLDTGALGTKALAKAILARQVRPRVGDIRRLAEAVLKKKSKKGGGKGTQPSKRKLSKIPAKGSK